MCIRDSAQRTAARTWASHRRGLPAHCHSPVNRIVSHLVQLHTLQSTKCLALTPGACPGTTAACRSCFRSQDHAAPTPKARNRPRMGLRSSGGGARGA
eukprot:13744446-Alexandrium_andersonii.AAC.1